MRQRRDEMATGDSLVKAELGHAMSRIADLECQLADYEALKAQIERLKAPVSDKEMDRFSIHYINVINPFRSLPVLTITHRPVV